MIKSAVKMFLALIAVHLSISDSFAGDDNTLGYISSDEQVVVSCSLSVKVKPVQPKDNETMAKAVIEVTLLSRDGAPVQGTQIDISATSGTFMCNTLTSDSGEVKYDPDDRSCFITNSDGKAILNLLNIPLNRQVRVKAKCTCGDYTLTASGSTTISKKIIRKKK